MDLLIHEMTQTELSEAAALEAENFSRPWSYEDFADALTKSQYLYYTASEEGRLVGMAGLLLLPPEAELTNVSVRISARRSGIARRILLELMEEGRRRGIREFSLEVRAGNIPAIALYESLGFVCEGRRKDFYRDPTEDALIYWLREKKD